MLDLRHNILDAGRRDITNFQDTEYIFMRLTVLADNNTYIDKYYLGEPALSYFIEDGDETILFDCGYSNVFLRNAERIGLTSAK